MSAPKLLAFVACGVFAAGSFASAESTDPVGFITMPLSDTSGGKNINVISFPLLLEAEGLEGATRGSLTGLTSTSISDDSAGWAPGELTSAAAPKLIKFTSGAAEGLMLLATTSTPNTASTVEIDPSEQSIADLVQLGVTVGDTYQILECDTLLSAFGTPATTGIVGGSSLTNADEVQLLVDGIWTTFFYNTDSNAWVRNSRGFPNSDNVRIKPDEGVLFNRTNNGSLDYTLTGSVPTEARTTLINPTGTTFIGSYWPIGLNLVESGIQSIPGWVGNGSIDSSDYIQVLSAGVWTRYWWDGSNWREARRGTPIVDDFVIEGGSAVFLVKVNATTDAALYQLPTPY